MRRTHLHRNAGDIAKLECLDDAKLKHATKFYDELAAVYGAIRAYKAEPFDRNKRRSQADNNKAERALFAWLGGGGVGHG